MVTTSLLSRGLDFSPEVKHVDEPRNMIDFLYRAGRSGRAGQSGKLIEIRKRVVVFTARLSLNLRPKYNGPLRSTLKKLSKGVRLDKSGNYICVYVLYYHTVNRVTPLL